jgi:hypothetical protein
LESARRKKERNVCALRTIIDLEEHLRSDSRELDVVNYKREQHKIEGIRSVHQERGNRSIAAPRSGGWGGVSMVAVPIAVAVSNYLLCFYCGDDFLVSKGEQQTAVVVKQGSRLSRKERAFLDFSCSGLLLHSCKQRRLKLRARADRDHIDVGNSPRRSLEELAVAARCNNAAAAAAAIVEQQQQQQQQHQQKSRRLQGVVPFTPSSEGGGSRSTCVRGVIEEEPNRSLDNEQSLVVAGPPCASPAKLLQVAVDVDEGLPFPLYSTITSSSSTSSSFLRFQNTSSLDLIVA